LRGKTHPRNEDACPETPANEEPDVDSRILKGVFWSLGRLFGYLERSILDTGDSIIPKSHRREENGGILKMLTAPKKIRLSKYAMRLMLSRMVLLPFFVTGKINPGTHTQLLSRAKKARERQAPYHFRDCLKINPLCQTPSLPSFYAQVSLNSGRESHENRIVGSNRKNITEKSQKLIRYQKNIVT